MGLNQLYSIQLNPLIVYSLRSTESYCWNIPLLHEHFDFESVETILKIPIPLRARYDRLIWAVDNKGTFSLKFAYKSNAVENQSSWQNQNAIMENWVQCAVNERQFDENSREF